MSFVTEYSLWYIWLCLATGALYTFILYKKETPFDDLGPWLKRGLAAFRLLVVSILAFLLLNPLLKTVFREVEKPIIIIAQDNSESLMIGKDSSYYMGEYQQQLRDMVKALANDYEVATYSFGEGISDGLSFSFDEKQTDISALLDEIYTRHSNRNVGAVLIATDGIYNKGANPVYASGKLKVPIYTIALGDTSIRKDLIISRVAHNRLAYLGNDFPLEILINAKRCAGHRAELVISKGGKKLFIKRFDIDSDDFLVKEPVLIEAKRTGIQKYTISLRHLEDEVSYENNQQAIFIDVMDDRQKVLILAHSPHPDIAAICNSIALNQNYEVKAMLAGDFNGAVKAHSLIILHQLPSSKYPIANILTEAEANNIPLLFIVGKRTAISKLNNLGAGLSIHGVRGKHNETQPVLSKEFTLFTLSDLTRNAIKNLPPLITHFGTFVTPNAAQVLFYQQIGMVKTDQALLVFNPAAEQKTAVVAGEGMWRWRLADYAEHNDHAAFDELIGKTVQYLSAKADKRRFRVTSNNNFLENEAIIFDAELYNASYELVNEPEVRMEITNSEGNRFPFTFSKTTNAYMLNAGTLPVGEYKYEAHTKIGEKIHTETGQFSVSEIKVETVNTTADHQLLYNLARKNAGTMLSPADLAKVPDMLKAREDVKPVSFFRKQLKDLINLKWVFALLLALLTVEWFLRKRNGAY